MVRRQQLSEREEAYELEKQGQRKQGSGGYPRVIYWIKLLLIVLTYTNVYVLYTIMYIYCIYSKQLLCFYPTFTADVPSKCMCFKLQLVCWVKEYSLLYRYTILQCFIFKSIHFDEKGTHQGFLPIIFMNFQTFLSQNQQ